MRRKVLSWNYRGLWLSRAEERERMLSRVVSLMSFCEVLGSQEIHATDGVWDHFQLVLAPTGCSMGSSYSEDYRWDGDPYSPGH